MRTRKLGEDKPKKDGKYRDKTLAEHVADGLTLILKDMGAEDKKLYYVMNDPETGKALHSVQFIGDHKELRASGHAHLGYFDQQQEGRQFEGIEVSYEFTGSVKKDNWNQEMIIVDDYDLHGADHLQIS